MENFFYYLSLSFLFLQAAYSVLVIIVSLFQFMKVNTEKMHIQYANLSIALQMLQATVILLIVTAVYYWLLRDKLVPVWIILIICGAIMTLNSILRDIHRRRLPL